MSYRALYRKYRPVDFDDVVGQGPITEVLKYEVANDKISHAYLFCGSRGTGKTSCAKILAKAVNCLNPKNGNPCNECEACRSIDAGVATDVIEMDAASNNGVGNVRDMKDEIAFTPALLKYRVYIIDEVHMMSTGAFNALLKTLEEPPSHVIFILATTEPHKVLPTIISRCQRFDFGRISVNDIKERVKVVLDSENITYEDGVIELICELCDGGMRDALSILDQAIAYAGNDLKCTHIREIYGVTSISEKIDLLNYISDNNQESIIDRINEYDDKGVDLTRLTVGLIDLLKEVIIYKNSGNKSILKVLSVENIESLKETNKNKMFKWIDILVETLSNFKKVNAPKSFFELACLKMANSDSGIKENVVYVTKEIEVSKPVEIINQEIKMEEKTVVQETKFSIPVKENKVEEVKAEPVKVSEPVITNEKYIPTEEELLNVLVQATKEALVTAKQRWVELTRFMNSPSTARVATLLMDGLPVAGAKNMLILAYENDTYLNRVNSVSDHKAMNNFLKAMYKENMMCYCVTKADFIKLKDTYMLLRNTNNLPVARPIVFDEVSENKVDESLEFGKKIFGDFLQIKEE